MSNRSFAQTTICLLSTLLWISACQQPPANTADYTRLETLLEQQDWRAADQETFQTMVVIAGKSAEGWLSVEDIEAFPCEELNAINQLWQTYSDRRFGFTIQTRLWEIEGGTPGVYDDQTALALGATVEWQTDGEWKTYDDLTFDAEAPPGHLPATTGNGVSGGVWGGVATLSGKVKACADVFDRLPERLPREIAAQVDDHQDDLRAEQLDCQGCILIGADLSGANLALADLSFADLRGADLQGTILGAAKLRFADLRGANLRGAVLRQASLYGALLDDANLRGADFHCGGGSCTFLGGASFQRADLTNANFDCIDCTVTGRRGLENVNFAGADLTDAILEDANFEGVNVNLCGATLPDGTVSPQGCPAVAP